MVARHPIAWSMLAWFVGMFLYLAFPLSSFAVSTSTLVSWWSFEEESGVRADSYGTNDLTDNNTVLFAAGKVGNAADFESSNSEYLSVNDNSTLDITSAITFCGWFKYESLPANGVIAPADKWVSGTNNRSFVFFLVDRSTSNWGYYVSSDGAESGIAFAATTGLDPGTSTWYHVCWVYDSSGDDYVVVDGTSYSLSDNSSAIFSGSAPLRLGAAGILDNYYMDGLMDEVSLWSSALSTDDIAELYNGGDGVSFDDLFAPEEEATTTATTTSELSTEDITYTIALAFSILFGLIFTYIGYKFFRIFI